MVRLESAGGLTSRDMIWPSGITTASPAFGTAPPGQDPGFDHLALPGGGPEGPPGLVGSLVQPAASRLARANEANVETAWAPICR